MQLEYPDRESVTVEFKSAFNIGVIESLVAFANTLGGTVYVGMNDAGEAVGVTLGKETVAQFVNEIKGKTSPCLVPGVEIRTSKGRNVVLLSIPEYPVKPVSVQGRYYKRVDNSNHLLATSEVVDMHLQSLNSSWDAFPDPVHNMDDIDLVKVQKAIEAMRVHGHSIIEDPLSFLLKYNLIRDGRPTNAAYLLFKQRDCFLSTVELGHFQTDIIIKDSDRSKSDLLTQIQEIMSFVQKHINKEIIITGEARNTERWQYPLEAIRELIMNMVIHRDYRSSADSIVKVYPDKIDFYNPGTLPQNITVEDLLNNTYRSQPRNKLIADFCKDMGLIEKYGSGIRRVLALFREAGLPAPQFREMSGGFNVTVFAGVEKSVVKSVENVTENSVDVTKNVTNVTQKADDVTENVTNVTENVTKNSVDVTKNVTNVTQKADDVTENVTNVTENRLTIMLGLIKEDPEMTILRLVEILKVTRRTVLRDLEKLKTAGRLRRIGATNGGHWEVVDDDI